MYCEMAGVNLFSLTCKLSKGSELCGDEKNYIVLLDAANGDQVSFCRIRTRDR